MVFVPRHRFNTNLVLTSGMGFDDFGELTYSGSTPVSGTGYLKTTSQYQVTNAGIETFELVEAFTDPSELTLSAGDQLEVTSGPAVVSGTTHRVTSVRPIVGVDGFHALDISTLQEVEI